MCTEREGKREEGEGRSISNSKEERCRQARTNHNNRCDPSLPSLIVTGDNLHAEDDAIDDDWNLDAAAAPGAHAGKRLRNSIPFNAFFVGLELERLNVLNTCVLHTGSRDYWVAYRLIYKRRCLPVTGTTIDVVNMHEAHAQSASQSLLVRSQLPLPPPWIPRNKQHH